MLCEYDGQVLPVSPDGVPDACPECERDLQLHLSECRTCRPAPNLPLIIDFDSLLEALS